MYLKANQRFTANDQSSQVDSTAVYQPLALAFLSGEQPAGSGQGPFEFDEIVVRGLWFTPTLRQTHSAVTVLSGHELDIAPSRVLSGVMSGVSGIHIKDYGGASALKTISQRGLGAEHTLVLVNGMRVNSFQNGLVDLGLYPVDHLERVEVLHGGYSAAYGSDAMGGVVNLVTAVPSGVPSGTVETSFGSFGYQKISAGGGAGWSGGGVHASVASEKGRENYPFAFVNGPVETGLTRTNADFSSEYATLGGFIGLDKETRMSSFIRLFRSGRGVGGPVLSPSTASVARQTDEDYLVQLSVVSSGESGTRLSGGVQVHSAYQRYQDPSLRVGPSDGLDTYFKNNDYRGSLSYTRHLFTDLSVSVGFEGASTRADGLSIPAAVTRWHGAAFLSADYSIPVSPEIFRQLAVRPAVRFDSFTGVAPSLNPQVGILAGFQDVTLGRAEIGTRLFASYNTNFRVPTFNELYYQGGGGIGNPLLRPEESTGFEVGGGFSADLGGLHEVTGSFYRSEMTDRIVWVSAGSFGVTPRNIRTVESSGTEFTWFWRPLNDIVSVRLNYSEIRSMKTSQESPTDRNLNTFLVYVPAETFNASAGVSLPPVFPGVERIEWTAAYHYVGLRYTNEDNSGSLPPYHLLDSGMSVDWGLGGPVLTTRLDVLNLLDAAYQVVLGYPMPGRSFRLTLAMTY
ncbi:MAG: TonB-dependent receptor [Ignavibacteria bacterium]|nr:TonB-dependent receptor [Ignavibacteria bacterium]